MALKLVHMQPRTAAAIGTEATKRGAWAGPVMNSRGYVDEVFAYRDGELKATIYRPEASQLAVCRMDEGAEAARVANVPEAVQRALDPLYKRKRLAA